MLQHLGYTKFESSATINRPYDETWIALIGLASERGCPIDVLESDSGFMSFENVALDESYVDCGSASFGSENVALPQGTVSVTVREDEARTTVRVNLVNATVTRRNIFDGSLFPEVACNSRGTFEREVLTALER